jgi:FkbM family methyltransferase
MRQLYRAAYKTFCALGLPFGGLRPRRLYDKLGRLAYDTPEFNWFRNRWGDELFLSHYYHIDRNILNFGCYDENLHLAIENLVKPGMVCFDVGANLGEITLHLARRVGPLGSVYAFEPVPAVMERLRQNIERNYPSQADHSADQPRAPKIHLFPLALSNASGKVQIATAGTNEDNQGLASLVNLDDKRTPARQEIQMVSLDEFVAQHQISRINLMKVDIQGAEIKLLEGGRRVFTEMAPDLLMEFSPQDLAAACKNSRDLGEALERYGYKIYRLNGGKVGTQIRADSVTPTFHATNVFCSQRPK